MRRELYSVRFVQITHKGHADVYECTIYDTVLRKTVIGHDANPARAFRIAVEKHPDQTIGFIESADPAIWDKILAL